MPYRNTSTCRFLLIGFVLALALCTRVWPFTVGPFAPAESLWTAPSASEIASYRAQKLIENIQRSRSLGPNDSVRASTCRKTLILSEYVDPKELLPKESDAAPALASFELDKPTQNVEELFAIIRSTVIGRAIFKKFLSIYGFEVKIQFRTEEQIGLRKHLAIAVYDPIAKSIWMDPSAPRGAVAYVLVHEMVHAVDRDNANALEKLLTLRAQFNTKLTETIHLTATRLRKPKEELLESDFFKSDLEALAKLKTLFDEIHTVAVFRTERFAYDASYDVWRALSRAFPQYYKGKLAPRYHSDSMIIKLNRLNPAIVRKYKAGQCLTH